MRYAKSKALFSRASKVIPGGIYGHASPAATIPEAFPYFAKSATGCRYTDIDDNEYIDYMCAYGPIVLGYNHAEVNACVAEVQQQGDCFNHPTEYSVRLAEKLTQIVDIADWAIFGKNGSDMTSWSIRVAREYTGRKRIAKTTHAYHGVDPWCVPGYGGIIVEDRSMIDHFEWNNLESLSNLIKKRGPELAAIMITPFHHPTFADSVLPTKEFAKTLNKLCRSHGILLILDDVRCGFRLHEKGSHHRFGFEPDLICYCKALGNGYPISACVGREGLKIAASKTFTTGSFWNAAAPMAAALKTLEIIERDKVIQQLEARGKELIKGMLKIGEKAGIALQASGPPAMPFVRVADDHSFRKQQTLCAAAARNGLFLHPHHNWFLNAAHTKKEIADSLSRFSATVSEAF